MFGMGQQRLAGANRALAQNQSQIAAGIGGLAAGFASGTFGDFFGNNQAPSAALGTGSFIGPRQQYFGTGELLYNYQPVSPSTVLNLE